MQLQLSASWSIVGIVVEARELTSQKNKNWKGYVAKVASLGATFELQLSVEQYRQLAAGQMLAFTGRFEEQSGRQRLVCDGFTDPKTEGGAK